MRGVGAAAGFGAAALVALGLTSARGPAADAPPSFAEVMAKMTAATPDAQKRHADLRARRYDLADRPAKEGSMTRGKPLQTGPRAKLPDGVTWQQLAGMTPEEV